MLIQQNRIPLKEVLLCGILPGFLKKAVYRARGYKMGKHVSIGFGSVICGKEVFIGDHTKIGFFTIIRGKKIRIGSFVHIGSTTFLDTPHLEIGDESKVNEQVFVGGLQEADSSLIIGKNCQIMQMSFINPAISIKMDDDSGIGGHGLVFGHASWQSVFEGYPAEFAPIEIGKNVALTWRSFILPGVRIGDGTVIGPGSLVNRDIPDHSLAAGFPIRILSKPPDFPKIVSDQEKRELLRTIEDKMVSYFRGSELSCVQEGQVYHVIKPARPFRKKRSWKLLFAYDAIDNVGALPCRCDVLVSLKPIPAGAHLELAKSRTICFDIETKTRTYETNMLAEEVALYLRRYGVRFIRRRADPSPRT